MLNQRLAMGEPLMYGLEAPDQPPREGFKRWRNALLDKKEMAAFLALAERQKKRKEKKKNAATIEHYKGALREPVRASAIPKPPGLFFRVEKNAYVRAVFRGYVAFADWFRGYGFLVILRHEGHVYSLYGHNRRLLVSRGDFVMSRQVIAQSGDVGVMDGEPGLYFEIRRGREPENPRHWLVGNEKVYSRMTKVLSLPPYFEK